LAVHLYLIKTKIFVLMVIIYKKVLFLHAF